VKYYMVWYESKLTLLSLNAKELSLPRAAAFNLHLSPFLNSTSKPPHPTTPSITSTSASPGSASACQTTLLG
jgi:hypothetical protein